MSGFDSPIRSFVRMVIYLGWTLVAIPVQGVALLLRTPFRVSFPMIYHRTCLKIIGVDIQVRGKKSKDHPVLFAVNHSSYLDISVLGALIAGSFVAKQEVAKWPLYGLLAKLQRTVFVDRRARFVAAQRDEMVARLAGGDDLILFPEGTSSDGNRVLPFKSSLLSTAEIEVKGKPITVQPVSIAYTHLDGIPLGRHMRPFFTWFGDMEMASHIWRVMGLGKLKVVVQFHPPLSIVEAGSRKVLAVRCWQAVAGGVSSAITGREQALVVGEAV
ncbi:MAG: lysophospholipid acyltransferase family protein [Alphaproteobacteria bacterium]